MTQLFTLLMVMALLLFARDNGFNALPLLHPMFSRVTPLMGHSLQKNQVIIKDLQIGLVLLKGPHKGGIYEWLFEAQSNTHSHKSQAFYITKASLQDWHLWLGHPSSHVLNQIVSYAFLLISSNKSFT
nr:uncharacterized protein LOC125423583 [Ziziphus jujuba var. spinosa]